MRKLSLFILTCLLFVCISCSESNQTISLITYNIRLDIESDGINKWDNRKEGLISLIKEENPDVLGIQEGLPNQIEYISKQLEDYNMIGEGRDGGDKGEYSAIFYMVVFSNVIQYHIYRIFSSDFSNMIKMRIVDYKFFI